MIEKLSHPHLAEYYQFSFTKASTDIQIVVYLIFERLNTNFQLTKCKYAFAEVFNFRFVLHQLFNQIRFLFSIVWENHKEMLSLNYLL